MRTRYKRNKRKSLGEWPVCSPSPEEVACKVQYIGSAEHKSYPSKAGSPAFRSDASRCDPRYKDKEGDITEALKKPSEIELYAAPLKMGFLSMSGGSWMKICMRFATLTAPLARTKLTSWKTE